MSIHACPNAPQILFDQAARPDLKQIPRFMVPVGDEFVPVTWAQFAERVEHIAAFLIEHGIDRDIKAAVLSNTRIEWGIAGLAIGAARGVLVPVYPTLFGEQLAHILAHSDSKLVFVENAEQLARVLSVWDRLDIQTLVTMDDVDVHRAAQEAGLDPDPIVASTSVLRAPNKPARRSSRPSPSKYASAWHRSLPKMYPHCCTRPAPQVCPRASCFPIITWPSTAAIGSASMVPCCKRVTLTYSGCP